MIRILPTFKGYTVDVRLREFRRIYKTKFPVFIPFDSDEGDTLLCAWLKTLPQAEYDEVVRQLF